VKHKWFVFVAGLHLGVPLGRLLVHDISKFTGAELPHYGRQFFGDKSDPIGFAGAWLHHQNHNPHHWEYWVPRSGHGTGPDYPANPLPMPETYVREMVADWMGASRAYDGAWPVEIATWRWVQQNVLGAKRKIVLHEETWAVLGRVLREAFE